MIEERNRLDICVMKKTGISRGLAADLIHGGRVRVNGSVAVKPGEKINSCCDLQIDMPERVYVGRGGYKLEGALDFFGIDLTGLVCADIGASTGGFTDCMLQRGATRVYAIENGKDQLAEKLRNDARVVSLENTNINELKKCIPENNPAVGIQKLRNNMDFIGVDVSFISITKIIEAAAALIRNGGYAVLLIKPQFEAGYGNIGKRGIVKNPKIHEKAICDVSSSVKDAGLHVLGMIRSPIDGRDGNVEFLMYCEKLPEVL